MAAATSEQSAVDVDWRADSHGGIGALTPDNYPIADFIGPNVFAILDSSHGFNVLALGQQAAADWNAPAFVDI